MWQALSARPIARHVIETHYQRCFLEFEASDDLASNIFQGQCPQRVWNTRFLC